MTSSDVASGGIRTAQVFDICVSPGNRKAASGRSAAAPTRQPWDPVDAAPPPAFIGKGVPRTSPEWCWLVPVGAVSFWALSPS